MKTKIRKIWDVLKYFFPTAHSVRPRYFLMLAIQVVLRSITPFISIIFPKLIIDELLSNQSVPLLVLYVSLLVGLNLIFKALHEVLKCTIEDDSDVIQRYFEMQIGVKSMNMDYQYTEDSEVLNQKNKARNGVYMNGGVEGLANTLVQIVSSVIVFIGVFSIILTTSPWVLLFVLLSVVFSTYIHTKVIRINRKYYEKTSNVQRISDYIFYDLFSFRYGKDVRLYHLSPLFEEKGTKVKDTLFHLQKEESTKVTRLNTFQIIFSSIMDFAGYFYIGWLALSKRFGIGTFTMSIAAMTSLSSSLSSIIDSFVNLNRDSDYLNDYISFIRYPDTLEKHDLPVPDSSSYTIELKDVSFKYPNTEKYVLKHINLTIHAGERLSIVGLNGEGKTTLVKLLTRLYDVTEGEIVINGTNIKEYEYSMYHQLFSVVFQDFKLFAFTIKENIWMDHIGKNPEALFILAGIKQKIDSLPLGMDTHIYKVFDDHGFEPSGGEGQKIAIARAIAKDAPIMILDEPTSALDPIAEYEIYHHFNLMIQNKTAVYISHRLSSCRFADKIALFHEGSLKEYGNHQSLMDAQGLYCEMYQTQSKYYSLHK